MADTDWRRTRKSRGKRGHSDEDQSEGGGSWTAPPAFSRPPPAFQLAPVPSADGPDVGATVKRYDAERGFGFVKLDDGGGDAFLHVKVLQRAGAETIAPGGRLRVRLGAGQKGLQVTEVLVVGDADASSPARTDRPPAASARPAEGAEEVRGTVKWYNGQKGFGFVVTEGGAADVFVHATALERSGIASLADGQSVMVRVVPGKKGPEVETVRAV